MISHDNSDAAKYFVKGLEYVKDMPPKKNRFSRHKKSELSRVSNIKNYVTIIGTTKKESIDFISESIVQKQNVGFNIDQILIVIVDYFKDSMIRQKYIRGKVLRANKTKMKPIFVFVEFNEMNTIVQIEDDYDQSYSYKSLSRDYTKQLQIVHEFCRQVDVNETDNQKTKPLKKGGPDFANSSLV